VLGTIYFFGQLLSLAFAVMSGDLDICPSFRELSLGPTFVKSKGVDLPQMPADKRFKQLPNCASQTVPGIVLLQWSANITWHLSVWHLFASVRSGVTT
jgi:hypothetical protein